MMDREKIIGIIFIALALIMSVAGYAILPDTVLIQVVVDGHTPNTLPKLAAVLIPTLIVVFGVATVWRTRDNRSYLVPVIGILVFILTFVFNMQLD